MVFSRERFGRPRLTDCSPFSCSSTSCGGACSSEAECAATAYCDGSNCIPKADSGKPCGENKQCKTGFCVDGVCCNTPCLGQCEACDTQSAVGTCLPVIGEPHGSRTKCATGSAEEACATARCDGTVRDACAGFLGPEVSCRQATCVKGVAITSAVCAGKGSCPAPDLRQCEPFACVGAACAKACTVEAHCAAGYRCDEETGLCLAIATCIDEVTLDPPGSAPQSCVPYRCRGVACLSQCNGVEDCAPGFLCNSDNSCVKARPDEDDDAGGCGCRIRPRQTPSEAAWLLLASVGLAARRRRWRIAGRPRNSKNPRGPGHASSIAAPRVTP